MPFLLHYAFQNLASFGLQHWTCDAVCIGKQESFAETWNSFSRAGEEVLSSKVTDRKDIRNNLPWSCGGRHQQAAAGACLLHCHDASEGSMTGIMQASMMHSVTHHKSHNTSCLRAQCWHGCKIPKHGRPRTFGQDCWHGIVWLQTCDPTNLVHDQCCSDLVIPARRLGQTSKLHFIQVLYMHSLAMDVGL